MKETLGCQKDGEILFRTVRMSGVCVYACVSIITWHRIGMHNLSNIPQLLINNLSCVYIESTINNITIWYESFPCAMWLFSVHVLVTLPMSPLTLTIRFTLTYLRCHPVRMIVVPAGGRIKRLLDSLTKQCFIEYAVAFDTFMSAPLSA